MSASKMPTPQPAERVGAAPRNKVVDGPADEPDFRTLLNAWLESHRASLLEARLVDPFWRETTADLLRLPQAA